MSKLNKHPLTDFVLGLFERHFDQLNVGDLAALLGGDVITQKGYKAYRIVAADVLCAMVAQGLVERSGTFNTRLSEEQAGHDYRLKSKKARIAKAKPVARSERREPHKIRIYRTRRLAKLLDVHETTIWRWWKLNGVLPPPVTIGGSKVRGWTEEMLIGVMRATDVAR